MEQEMTAQIARLRELHAASTQGEWSSQTYSNYAGWSVWAPGGAGCIAERWYATGTQDQIPRNDLFIAAAHNALPAILDALEAAVKERDELRADRHFAVDMIRHLDPENLCDFIDELGAEEHLRQWLAARDARMKKLGAVEALEDIAKDHGIEGGRAYLADVVYREFPDRLTMRVGVVDAAELMNRAAQLRREGEE